jgi:preprotein translocase subunit SecE
MATRPASPPPSSGRRGRFSRVSTYVRQVVAELRKVIWPTRNELVTYTIVSIVFVSAMVAIVSLFDFVFTKAVLAIFG